MYSMNAPIMLLSGHEGEVMTLKFSPDGTVCASGSFDKTILLWRVFTSDCENYMLLQGHRNTVLELHWTQNDKVISCSPDRTVRAWDVQKGEQVKIMKHGARVNSCY